MSRIVIWFESVVGGGHLQVADMLARGALAAGLETHLVSGSFHRSPDLDFGGAVQHAYPKELGLHHEAARGYVTSNGIPLASAGALLERRRAFLHDVIGQVRPDAILTEHWPFGRGHLDREILPVIEAVKADRPWTRLYGSARDVMLLAEGEHAGGSADASADIVNRLFDRIFVHADPAFVRFEDSFPATARIQAKLSYTGYLVHPMSRREIWPDERRPVVVSCGAGRTQDGADLYLAAIACRQMLPPRHPLAVRPWQLFVSPAYDEEFLQLVRERASASGREMDVVGNLPGPAFRAALVNAALSISLGGYNTVIETYVADVPAVLLPYHNRAGGQSRRAQAFAVLGKMVVLPHAGRCDPRCLRAALERAWSKRRVKQRPLRLAGEGALRAQITHDLAEVGAMPTS